MTAREIHVRLVGRVEVMVGARPVVVPAGRQRILLAALALEAGRAVSVERLVAYMWEHAQPDDPRAGVQNNVLRLRRVLGFEAIGTVTDGYLLHVDPDHVDALWIQRLADQLAGAPATEQRQDQIDAALEHWQDEPLHHIGSERLARDHGPRILERYLTLVEIRCDDDLADGRYTRLVGELRDLTTRYRLRESLWVKLITALRDSGRHAEALEAYEQIRVELAESLGADPSPPLQQLHAQILRADPVATMVGTSRMVPEKIGDPDLARIPVSGTPRQLPAGPALLVGRDLELAHLDGQADKGTVCTIHGPGGVGKTALALTFAHRRAGFPDGELYLDLQGYGPGEALSPGGALAHLLRALGFRDKDLPLSVEERSALLRSTLATKAMLILLDNARTVEQVRPLLPAGDSLVLVTSRSELRGLTVRDGAGTVHLRELSDHASAQLVDRILGEDGGSETADLISLCGGLPLALWIAADLVRRFPDDPGQIVARLRDPTHRLDTLSGPDDPASDLRTVFSWSLRALNAETVDIFRLLGLNPSRDIGTSAAAALAGITEPEARRRLENLVGVHLLERSSPGRYRMHDLLRDYATERVTSDIPAQQRNRAIRRFLDWCLHNTTTAYNTLRSQRPFVPTIPPVDDLTIEKFADFKEALTWVRSEHNTVIAAVQLAAEHGLHDHAWQLPRALHTYLAFQLYDEDDIQISRIALDSAQHTGDARAIEYAARGLGHAYVRTGRTEATESTLQIALEAARQLNEPDKISWVCTLLGVNAGRQEEDDRAIAFHREAIAVARRNGSAFQLARALHQFGSTLLGTGQYAEAIAHIREALEIAESKELPTLLYVQALQKLAEAHRLAGEPALAVQYGEQALPKLRALEEQASAIEVLISLGQAKAAMGSTTSAREHLQDALSILNPGHPRATRIRRLLADLPSA